MNDSGQMMPYQELWERLKQVTGERNRLEAELAALEANPPLEAPVLAEVEGWIDTEDLETFQNGLRDYVDIFKGDGSRYSYAANVTVTIRGRGDVPEPPAISSSIR